MGREVGERRIVLMTKLLKNQQNNQYNGANRIVREFLNLIKQLSQSLDKFLGKYLSPINYQKRFYCSR